MLRKQIILLVVIHSVAENITNYIQIKRNVSMTSSAFLAVVCHKRDKTKQKAIAASKKGLVIEIKKNDLFTNRIGTLSPEILKKRI